MVCTRSNIKLILVNCLRRSNYFDSSSRAGIWYDAVRFVHLYGTGGWNVVAVAPSRIPQIGRRFLCSTTISPDRRELINLSVIAKIQVLQLNHS